MLCFQDSTLLFYYKCSKRQNITYTVDPKQVLKFNVFPKVLCDLVGSFPDCKWDRSMHDPIDIKDFHVYSWQCCINLDLETNCCRAGPWQMRGKVWGRCFIAETSSSCPAIQGHFLMFQCEDREIREDSGSLCGHRLWDWSLWRVEADQLQRAASNYRGSVLLLARHPRLGILELWGVQQAGWRVL